MHHRVGRELPRTHAFTAKAGIIYVLRPGPEAEYLDLPVMASPFQVMTNGGQSGSSTGINGGKSGGESMATLNDVGGEDKTPVAKEGEGNSPDKNAAAGPSTPGKKRGADTSEDGEEGEVTDANTSTPTNSKGKGRSPKKVKS